MTRPSTGPVEPGKLNSVVVRRMPALAGVLYSPTGLVLLIGIIAAETKCPVWRHYSTRQEISNLGGTRPPHSVVTQPAATIFDITMIVAGVLLLVAAWAAWRPYQHTVLCVVSARRRFTPRGADDEEGPWRR